MAKKNNTQVYKQMALPLINTRIKKSFSDGSYIIRMAGQTVMYLYMQINPIFEQIATSDIHTNTLQCR